MGRDPDALAAGNEALALLNTLYIQTGRQEPERIAVLETRIDVAAIHQRLGQPEEAASALRKALDQSRSLAQRNPDDPRWHLQSAELAVKLLTLPDLGGRNAHERVRILAADQLPHTTASQRSTARELRQRLNPLPAESL